MSLQLADFFCKSSQSPCPRFLESTPEVKAFPPPGLPGFVSTMAFSDFRRVRRDCHGVGVHRPTTTDLPRLPAPPHYPGGPRWVRMSVASPSAWAFPEQQSGRVHDFPFEACSGFARVTARWIAQPPFGGLCHEVSTRTSGAFLHWCYAPSGRTAVEKVSDEVGVARLFELSRTVPNYFACPVVMGRSRNASGGLVQHWPPDMFFWVG
jgi:hypothetical protein